MNWFLRLLGFRSPPKSSATFAPASTGQVRSLKAAMGGRLTDDWQPGGGDINQELRAGLSKSRLRARDQGLNNNYVRRYLRMCENHIVGPMGFSLQVKGKLKSGKTDVSNNRRIEQYIADWSSAKVCDITGRRSFAAIQRLVARSVARDGEALVRLWDIQPTARNKLGLVLEVLDPARLDHLLNMDLRNGNRVRMGIEINAAGKPLAYYLLTNLAGESVYQTRAGQMHERVPAENLLHIYTDESPEQLRGLTWMSAPMLKLHHLDGYSDAAITAARVGAAKMGFFESADSGLGAHAVADTQLDGEYYTSAEPGEFGVLPKGWQFKPFNPDYPSNAYDPFTKAALREAASGFGVSYHGLTGDLRDVNFSSIRSGTLEEREEWMTKQQWLIDQLLDPIYERLLSNIALYNLLNLDPSLVLDRFASHIWQGRRWQWVDPFKDISTSKLAVESGFKSPQRVAAEQGMDIEDVLDELAEFERMVQDRKLTLPAWLVPNKSMAMVNADTTGGNDATNQPA